MENTRATENGGSEAAIVESAVVAKTQGRAPAKKAREKRATTRPRKNVKRTQRRSNAKMKE